MKKIFLLAFLLTSCGEMTIEEIYYIETDTTIKSTDTLNRSTENVLQIAKTTAGESRAILKLPTKSLDESNNDELFEELDLNPLEAWLLAPWIITMEIIADIFSCNEVTTPANLTSAYLKVTVSDANSQSLNNAIQMQFLSKPWWHSASWLVAHPFSKSGAWTNVGGDTDGTTPILGALSGSDISYDITSYFRNAITNNGVTHYGMLLSAAGTSLNQIQLVSSQGSSISGPRVVATYVGICNPPTTSSSSTYHLKPNSLVQK